MKQNGKWNFINGSDLDYSDACVLCRTLGENVKGFGVFVQFANLIFYTGSCPICFHILVQGLMV